MSILETTANILKLMVDQQGAIRISDVIRHLDMPKSTASRVMSQLESYGYLEKDDVRGTFMPGPLIMSASHLVSRQLTLNDHVDVALRSLCERTGYTGYISILDDQEILVLRVIHGRQALPAITWPGSRSPAWGTSTGRALLARFTDTQLHDFFASPLVISQLTGSQHDISDLVAAVVRSRDAGYATAVNESVADTASVSCAVGDPATHEAVAFCLSFPQQLATPEELQRIATLLKEAAIAIAGKTGDTQVSSSL
ncbi:TPA_asm: helix-turn-helix domain-containing protein [Salmonella enterica subsp. enterica serovar Mbandaka]|uniref:IclR family transcriptional regulator n=1 Tax=Enterobacteriaceae TaxID=543 RepID=UPI001804864A|nr:IclR family transcriptional regulator [Klebsiella variicola]HAB5397348.1 helix-turn-helix domain-containing protein [Salmonella enterica subsp. enterica serovar Mbandaka]